MKAIIELPPIEWDFRNISKEEAPDAVLYEYARSHEKIEKHITELLDSTLPDPTEPATRITFREAFVRNRDAFDLDLKVPEHFFFGNHNAINIAFSYPDFPLPFAEIKRERKWPNLRLPFQAYTINDAPWGSKAFTINQRASQGEIRRALFNSSMRGRKDAGVRFPCNSNATFAAAV